MSIATTAPGTPSAQTGQNRRGQGWKRLVLSWVTLFTAGTDLFIVSPLLPIWHRAFHISVATASLTVTVFAVVYIVGAPLWGRIAARHDRRIVLLAALCCFAAGNLATAAAPWFWLLLVARAATGLSVSGISATVYTLAGEAAPPGRRAAWLGVATSGFLSALWVGAPLGGLLADHLGWRPVFIALTSAALILVLPCRGVWRMRDAVPAAKARRTGADDSGSGHAPASISTPLGLRALAVAPTTWWSASLYGLYTYLVTGLQTYAHWDSAQQNTALVTYGVGAVLASLLGARLADHGRAHHVVTAGFVAMAGAEVCFGLSLHAAALFSYAALGLIAVCAYVVFPAQQACLLEDHPHDTARLMAWNQGSNYVGIMLGSTLGGHVLAAFGFRTLILTSAVFAAGGAATSIARRPAAAALSGGVTPRRTRTSAHAAETVRTGPGPRTWAGSTWAGTARPTTGWSPSPRCGLMSGCITRWVRCRIPRPGISRRGRTTRGSAPSWPSARISRSGRGRRGSRSGRSWRTAPTGTRTGSGLSSRRPGCRS